MVLTRAFLSPRNVFTVRRGRRVPVEKREAVSPLQPAKQRLRLARHLGRVLLVGELVALARGEVELQHVQRVRARDRGDGRGVERVLEQALGVGLVAELAGEPPKVPVVVEPSSIERRGA